MISLSLSYIYIIYIFICFCNNWLSEAGWFCGGVWSRRAECAAAGDDHDIRTGVHRLCDGHRSQERKLGDDRTACHCVHSWCECARGWAFFRGVHEPGKGVRASTGGMEVEESLDLLARTLCGRSSGWTCIRVWDHTARGSSPHRPSPAFGSRRLLGRCASPNK